tara:strand:+ start:974 stop:1666 length:693 start_codon:yes stop_codon:yes gene_type:complete
MTKLYVNGDSYTQGLYIEPEERYANLIAKEFNWNLFNEAHYSKSNYGIYRQTIEYVLRHLGEEDMFVCVGFSHNFRQEVFYNSAYYSVHKDVYRIQTTDASHDLTSADEYGFKQYCKYLTFVESYDHSLLKTLDHFMMLSLFLESHNVPYILHNTTKPIHHSMMTRKIEDELDKNPKIVNLHNNTYEELCTVKGFIPFDYDLYGVTGHQGPEGNYAYYEFLSKKIHELYD